MWTNQYLGIFVMDVLSVVVDLVHQHWVGVKRCSSAQVNMIYVHQNVDISPFQVLHTLSHVKKL